MSTPRYLPNVSIDSRRHSDFDVAVPGKLQLRGVTLQSGSGRLTPDRRALGLAGDVAPGIDATFLLATVAELPVFCAPCRSMIALASTSTIW